MSCLDVLTRYSNRYGANPDLVLAGGGNTSAKEDGILYIKGSGVSLAEIHPGDFVKMDIRKLQAVFEKQYPRQDSEREKQVLEDLMAARCEGEGEKRPSVETPLHALFPQVYVLHVHPALVNGLTCSLGGEAAARAAIQKDFIWVESCRPGYVLSDTCKKAMAAYRAKKGKDANLILLQNHGIFFAADSEDGLQELLESVLHDLAKQIQREPLSAEIMADGKQEETGKVLAQYLEGQTEFCFCSGGDITRFCHSLQNAVPLLSPFTPDHIVYCKAYPLFMESLEKAQMQIAQYRESNGYLPRVLLLQGVGAFCFGNNDKQVNTCRDLFLDALKIAVYAKGFGGCRHLEKEMTDFIVNWEVESYRAKQLA